VTKAYLKSQNKIFNNKETKTKLKNYLGDQICNLAENKEKQRHNATTLP
jgi:hypothetical protein